MIKITVATRSLFAYFKAIKCAEFDFVYGLAPDPAEGAYSSTRSPSWNLGVLILRVSE